MEGTFLTVPQALLVAFCGLLIVFIMLAALSGIMYLLSKVLNAAPKQEAAPASAPAAPTAPAAPAAPGKTPAGQKACMKKVSCSAPVTALSGTAACPLLQKACSRGREHEGTGVCALPPCDTPTMFRSRL